MKHTSRKNNQRRSGGRRNADPNAVSPPNSVLPKRTGTLPGDAATKEPRPAVIGEEEGGPLPEITPEERARVLALDGEAALAAVEAEEPGALTVAMEHVLLLSEKASRRIAEGRDYLDLLAPAPDTSPIVAIAMSIVSEAIEEEIEEEMEDEAP